LKTADAKLRGVTLKYKSKTEAAELTLTCRKSAPKACVKQKTRGCETLNAGGVTLTLNKKQSCLLPQKKSAQGASR